MQKINTRNILLVLLSLSILVVIALLIGKFTYSFLGADVDEDIKNQGEVTASGDTIIFSKGNNLSLSASTDNFYTGSGNLTDTTNPSVRLIASNKTNNASSTYYAGIKILNNTFTYSTANETAELILTVKDETGATLTTSSDELEYVTVNGVSGFDITNKKGAFNIAVEHPINTTSSTTGTTHTWTFVLTFINLDTDQSINENASLDIDVVLQKDIIEISLADYCTGKTLTDCITTQVYTGTNGENDLYYHDTNLANSAADNSYRYAGANPNNYVCFGSDAATCPEDNLYRIIGVFDNEIKLIKSTIYGSYEWDSGNDNSWSTSDIKTTLNTTYYNTLSATWQNKIATHTWKVGGMAWSTTNTAKQYYDTEVGSSSSSTTDIMKIGLMYVSDYGFAVSPDYWTTALYSYSNSTLRSTNWLYLGSHEWTISPISSYSTFVFLLNYDGTLNNDYASNGYSARPVFYLNSNVTYVSGDGIESNPYRIS